MNMYATGLLDRIDRRIDARYIRPGHFIMGRGVVDGLVIANVTSIELRANFSSILNNYCHPGILSSSFDIVIFTLSSQYGTIHGWGFWNLEKVSFA